MTTELARIKIILTKLDNKIQALREQIAELEQDKAAVARTVVLYEKEIGLPPSDYGQLGVTVADLQHCKTQLEAIRAYARLNNGLVPVNKVAKTMYDAGLTKGKLTSIRSTVYRHVSSHPDEWNYVEPGIFQQKEHDIVSDDATHNELRLVPRNVVYVPTVKETDPCQPPQAIDTGIPYPTLQQHG